MLSDKNFTCSHSWNQKGNCNTLWKNNVYYVLLCMQWIFYVSSAWKELFLNSMQISNLDNKGKWLTFLRQCKCDCGNNCCSNNGNNSISCDIINPTTANITITTLPLLILPSLEILESHISTTYTVSTILIPPIISISSNNISILNCSIIITISSVVHRLWMTSPSSIQEKETVCKSSS